MLTCENCGGKGREVQEAALVCTICAGTGNHPEGVRAEWSERHNKYRVVIQSSRVKPTELVDWAKQIGAFLERQSLGVYLIVSYKNGARFEEHLWREGGVSQMLEIIRSRKRVT